ncbi:hypothetical protein K6119_19225 [Paracrocinitomix mangrovi]|uniref:hypothetical protein n=1 Tax=Paracrocinitomix mangrovi TaxID=2862509 RepID=UPI001C8D91F8|nr:hypothetical protein [Paracrocinitomix mangrovi]UKN01858.1 hypothetical protein K6119_19225 [Paracrocinitomix mangrovi]
MKKYLALPVTALIIGLIVGSCEKEQPAETIAGNYSGVLSGVYNGVDTLAGNVPVLATVVSKNKVKIDGDLFPAFEVLVTTKGINVEPVSTDDEVFYFLYQGNLNELSFKYYKDGDSTHYTGTKQ